jgi:ornithine carbamoyltransferase
MKGRDFLSIHDFTTEEVYQLLDLADELKAKQKRGEEHHLLKGKTLGMIFQKASTRTRVSFEVGIWQLGGYGLYLNAADLQIGRGEPIADTARTLSRYVDGIMIRTYAHNDVVQLAKYADIPVINGLTDLLHPCQIMADLMTAREYKKELKGLKLAYIGDGNNVAQELMFGGAKVGMHVSIASPAGYKPLEELVKQAQADAEKTGASIEVVDDPFAAAQDADVLYTDVWASMGQEQEQLKRAAAFKNYQINAELLKVAASDAIVMHCLPAHRGEELTEEVIEGPQSVVFDEAENRLHAQKAIMAVLMG